LYGKLCFEKGGQRQKSPHCVSAKTMPFSSEPPLSYLLFIQPMGSPNPGAGEYEKDKKAGLSAASAARLSLNLSPGYRFVPIDLFRSFSSERKLQKPRKIQRSAAFCPILTGGLAFRHPLLTIID